MRDEQMSDAALDRDIQEALAVQPSAGFAARLRARLASEPDPAAWPMRGIFAGACAVAAAVVLAIVASIPRPPDEHVSSLGDTQPPPAQVVDTEPSPSAEPLKVDASERRGVPRSRARSRSRTQPEVILSPAELKGLRQMMAAVREGRFQAVFPPDPFDADAPLAAEPEITIPPITIEPIDRLNQVEGVSQ